MVVVEFKSVLMNLIGMVSGFVEFNIIPWGLPSVKLADTKPVEVWTLSMFPYGFDEFVVQTPTLKE